MSWSLFNEEVRLCCAAQMIIHCKSFLGPWVVNILFAPDLDLYQYQLFVTKGRAPPKYSWKASDDIACRNIIELETCHAFLGY